MVQILQHRRNTTVGLQSERGSVGEIIIDTTKNTVVVMDGVTDGGTPLAKASDIPTDVSDLTDNNGLLSGIGGISNNDVLQIGTSNANLRLNSVNQSALLVAKKSFNRNFYSGDGYTLTANTNPNIVEVTFDPNTGVYFRHLLERLEFKLNFGSTDFIWDYSNIQIMLNPDDQAVTANITSVSQTNSDPLTYEITIDEDPTTVIGNLTDIVISYDYNNTVGLDVEEDRFGIATDNDDIDIRSGRDIDLIAADDIVIQAGSQFDIIFNQNDDQGNTGGIVITTNTNTSNNSWIFRFDGSLQFPDNTVQTTAFITPTTDTPIQGTFPIGEASAVSVTNSPNVNWTNGTGVLANGINFAVSVDVSGNATVSSISDGGSGHFVGETFGPVPGTAFGGTSPADDMYFEVTAINTGSVTALDITKQTQILTAAGSAGAYSLADGVEGQIMYFVPASTANNDVYVAIANARIIGMEGLTNQANYSWTPFTGEFLAPTTIAMAIFADGAWCLRGGTTD
jgi:hypothetical protein